MLSSAASVVKLLGRLNDASDAMDLEDPARDEGTGRIVNCMRGIGMGGSLLV